MDRQGSRVDFRSAEGESVGASLPKDAWVHLALAYDNGVARFYLDGKQQEEKIGIPLGTARNAKTRVGAVQECPDYFYGTIDEVRIYSRVLTSGEIRALASSGSRANE